MYWFKSVLLLVLMVVCIVAMTSADLRCYSCKSGNPGCYDPFDKSRVNTAVCRFPAESRGRQLTCFKYKFNGTGNETITAIHYTAIIIMYTIRANFVSISK